jgi:hypothetical protein
MYLFGRIVLVRRVMAHLGRRRERRFAASGSVFDRRLVRTVVDRLRDDGVDASLRLPPLVVEEIASLARRVAAPLPYPGSGAPVEAAIDALGTDPTFVDIAGSYLGRPPRYAGSRVWWLDESSEAVPASSGTRFHYDLYDYGAVAFLCYLTDVDASGGPHLCVRQSHRLRRWSDQLRPTRQRSDEDVLASYGHERIVTVTGPAGTVIAEDPFCFHRAGSAKHCRRLSVQFLYTARDFPTLSFQRLTASAAPRLPDRG